MKKGVLNVRWNHLFRRIAVGTLAGLLTIGLLCAVAAGVIAAEWIGETSMDYIIVAIILAAAVITGLIGIRGMENGRLPVALMGATALYLVLLLLGGVLFPGGTQAAGVTALLIYGGVIVSCLVKKRKRGYPKGKRFGSKI